MGRLSFANNRSVRGFGPTRHSRIDTIAEAGYCPIILKSSVRDDGEAGLAIPDRSAVASCFPTAAPDKAGSHHLAVGFVSHSSGRRSCRWCSPPRLGNGDHRTEFQRLNRTSLQGVLGLAPDRQSRKAC